MSARLGPTGLGLAALIAVAVLWSIGAQSTYAELLTLWGIVPFRFPFFDADGALAAWECSRQGIDIIASNPCDLLHRSYNNSPFWMSIDWIPLDRRDRIGFGLTLDVAFLISLSALPAPLSRSETALRLAAVLSTMVVFAVERVNHDLLIFVLTLLALNLLRRSPGLRVLGYAIAFLAGAIKYYPFVLLGLVARERLKALVVLSFALLSSLALFFWIYQGEIGEGMAYIPHGTAFGDMFGAINLPMGLFVSARSRFASNLPAVEAMLAVMAALLTLALLLMVRLWRAADFPGALDRLDEPRRLALFAGAALLCGCFFAGQSVGYRGILLFLVMPGLFALGQDKAARFAARTARAAVMIIPLLMWSEAIRLWIHLAMTGDYPQPGFINVRALDEPLDLLVWLIREIGWWFLIAVLLDILLVFSLQAWRRAEAELPRLGRNMGRAPGREPEE